jgi:hypothetical protein
VLVFRFYLLGVATPFWERRYRGTSIIPPIPRKEEKVVLDNKVYVVVETPTHYFETVHEVGFVVQEALGDNLEPAETPKKSASSVATRKPKVSLCKYCRDEDCPGGEDCNFYDGSLE